MKHHPLCNLLHAVMTFQGDEKSYLFEAAKGVVDALHEIDDFKCAACDHAMRFGPEDEDLAEEENER